MTVKQSRSPGRTRSDRHVQPHSASLNFKKFDEIREKCSWGCTTTTNSVNLLVLIVCTYSRIVAHKMELFWYIILHALLFLYTRAKIRFSHCGGLSGMDTNMTLFFSSFIIHRRSRTVSNPPNNAKR